MLNENTRMGEYTVAQLLALGWTLGQLQAADDEGYSFVSVKVLAPCQCSACSQGMRWFYCQKPICLEEIVCMADGCTPTKAALAEIRVKYPTEPLLYIG